MARDPGFLIRPNALRTWLKSQRLSSQMRHGVAGAKGRVSPGLVTVREPLGSNLKAVFDAGSGGRRAKVGKMRNLQVDLTYPGN